MPERAVMLLVIEILTVGRQQIGILQTDNLIGTQVLQEIQILQIKDRIS